MSYTDNLDRARAKTAGEKFRVPGLRRAGRSASPAIATSLSPPCYSRSDDKGRDCKLHLVPLSKMRVEKSLCSCCTCWTKIILLSSPAPFYSPFP